MKHNRHSVIRIDRPPGWLPSSPTDVPESILEVARIDLGRAAAEAKRLNEAEMAKGDDARFLFLPLKCFESPPRRKRRRRPSPQQRRRDRRNRLWAEQATESAAAGSQPSPSYADAPMLLPPPAAKQEGGPR